MPRRQPGAQQAAALASSRAPACDRLVGAAVPAAEVGADHQAVGAHDLRQQPQRTVVVDVGVEPQAPQQLVERALGPEPVRRPRADPRPPGASDRRGRPRPLRRGRGTRRGPGGGRARRRARAWRRPASPRRRTRASRSASKRRRRASRSGSVDARRRRVEEQRARRARRRWRRARRRRGRRAGGRRRCRRRRRAGRAPPPPGAARRRPRPGPATGAEAKPQQAVGVGGDQRGHRVVVAPAEGGRGGRLDVVEVGERVGRQHLQVDAGPVHGLEAEVDVHERPSRGSARRTARSRRPGTAARRRPRSARGRARRPRRGRARAPRGRGGRSSQRCLAAAAGHPRRRPRGSCPSRGASRWRSSRAVGPGRGGRRGRAATARPRGPGRRGDRRRPRRRRGSTPAARSWPMQACMPAPKRQAPRGHAGRAAPGDGLKSPASSPNTDGSRLTAIRSITTLAPAGTTVPSRRVTSARAQRMATGDDGSSRTVSWMQRCTKARSCGARRRPRGGRRSTRRCGAACPHEGRGGRVGAGQQVEGDLPADRRPRAGGGRPGCAAGWSARRGQVAPRACRRRASAWRRRAIEGAGTRRRTRSSGFGHLGPLGVRVADVVGQRGALDEGHQVAVQVDGLLGCARAAGRRRR